MAEHLQNTSPYALIPSLVLPSIVFDFTLTTFYAYPAGIRWAQLQHLG